MSTSCSLYVSQEMMTFSEGVKLAPGTGGEK